MVVRNPSTAQARAGFTLLEVLLASAIGVMLLAGLYVAVDVQLNQMHVARRAGEQSALASRLLSRIAQDLTGQLAPMLPAATTSSSTAGGSSGSSGSTGSGTSGAGAAGGTSGAGGTAGAAAGAAPSNTTTAANVTTFNNGILGDNLTLIITSSRVPGENLKPEILQTGDQVFGTSDVRRVLWWIAGGDAGLARYELKTVTDPNQLAYFALPPGVPDETSYVLAPEVKSIQFQYFDGTSWQDSWDGSVASTLPNSDTVTPQGPPVAIAVVIGIQSDDPGTQPATTAADTALGGGPGMKMYRRVIAIPTANGQTITPATNPSGQ